MRIGKTVYNVGIEEKRREEKRRDETRRGGEGQRRPMAKVKKKGVGGRRKSPRKETGSRNSTNYRKYEALLNG